MRVERFKESLPESAKETPGSEQQKEARFEHKRCSFVYNRGSHSKAQPPNTEMKIWNTWFISWKAVLWYNRVWMTCSLNVCPVFSSIHQRKKEVSMKNIKFLVDF